MLYLERFQTIKDVGVELEGGISERALKLFEEKTKRGNFYDKVSIGYDGSVNVTTSFASYDWISNIEIRFWSNDIDELLHYVDVLFSLGFYQNQTCGNHHHFTFTSSLAFSIAATPTFYKDFIREYTTFAKKRGEKYMKRLRNSYCRAPSTEHDILYSIMARDRYFAINFCSIFKHSTLEIRLLPYADSYKEFEEMHIWLCRTLDRLLKKHRNVLSCEVKW